jgi:hypothetical protein
MVKAHAWDLAPNTNLLFTWSGSGSGRGNAWRPDMKCFYCNKPGLYAQECKKKMRDLENGKSNGRGNSSANQSNSNNLNHCGHHQGCGHGRHSCGQGGGNRNYANIAANADDCLPQAWIVEINEHALAEQVPELTAPSSHLHCTIDSGATTLLSKLRSIFRFQGDCSGNQDMHC